MGLEQSEMDFGRRVVFPTDNSPVDFSKTVSGKSELEKMVSLVEEYRLLTHNGTHLDQNYAEQKLLVEKAVQILDSLCLTKPSETSGFLRWVESVFEALQPLFSESEKAYLCQRLSTIRIKSDPSTQHGRKTDESGQKWVN